MSDSDDDDFVTDNDNSKQDDNLNESFWSELKVRSKWANANVVLIPSRLFDSAGWHREVTAGTVAAATMLRIKQLKFHI